MTFPQHGHAGRGRVTKTYRAWQNMRRRCTDPATPQFNDYGGRGITICPEWDTFSAFLADMGEAPADKSLDRKDNNGGYSKANCRWATRREQTQNTRKNVFLAYRGKTLCVTEWARLVGLPLLTLYTRLHLGWSIKDALTIPAIKGRNQFGGERVLSFHGKEQTVHQWAKQMGIKPGTLHMRLWRGCSIEQALQQ